MYRSYTLLYTSLFTKQVAQNNKTQNTENWKKNNDNYEDLTKYYRLLQNLQKLFTEEL